MFLSLGEYVKVKECHEKALAICIETGNRATEMLVRRGLGDTFYDLGEYAQAKEYNSSNEKGADDYFQAFVIFFFLLPMMW